MMHKTKQRSVPDTEFRIAVVITAAVPLQKPKYAF